MQCLDLQTTDEGDTPTENDLSLLEIDTRGDNSSILVIIANSGDVIPLNTQEKKSVDIPSTLAKPMVISSKPNKQLKNIAKHFLISATQI